MIHCESSIERDYIKILDYDTSILDITHQPIVIFYRYKGRVRKYFPDFKVLTKEGRVWIAEIKPFKKIEKPENIIKFIVGRLYCEKMGWEFRVITDMEIRKGYLQSNLSLIRALGKQAMPYKSLLYVLNTLQESGICSIEMLRDNCNELATDEFYKVIYSLIYHKKIYVDLINNELSDTTLITNNMEEW